jgi:hypothetical protein
VLNATFSNIVVDEDFDEEEDPFGNVEGKIGAKKLKKLQDKAEKKSQRLVFHF